VLVGAAAAVAASAIPSAAPAQDATANSAPPDILGVDSYSYRGDVVANTLRIKHGFRVMGFYLSHSPKKLDTSWSDAARANLLKNAWGLFPIYIGEQTDSPPPGKGTKDGRQAVKLMKSAGFATGSVIYLDIENHKDEGGPYAPYIHDWMRAVRAADYYPGFYSVYTMAPWLTQLSSAVWTVELPKSVSASFKDDASIQSLRTSDGLQLLFENGILAYDPSKYPHGIMRPGCIATQYLWHQTFPEVPPTSTDPMEFDFTWSKVADPSNTANIAEALGIATLK
jgi:hypothetical protein